MKRTPRSAVLALAIAAIFVMAYLAALTPGGTAAITTPVFGAAVTASTTDFRPSLSELDTTPADPAAYIARWDRGTAADITDDCFYIHFGNSGDTALTVSSTVTDYRLGGGDASACPPGFLTSSSTEITSGVTVTDWDGAGALTDFRTLVRWLELDGKPGLSDGDAIYVDLTSAATGCTGGAGTLGVCDLRLTTRTFTGTSLAYGTMVKSGNADLAESADQDGVLPDTATLTALGGAASVQLHYYDANENRVADTGDSLYLRITDGGPGSQEAPTNYAALVPIAMDIRLTAFSSKAAGTVVVAGDNDFVPTLEAAPTNRVVRVAGASTATDKIILHFGTGAAPASVQFGDIALNTVTGQTAGQMATTAATGVGLSYNAISAGSFESLVFYVDINSNGRFDDADGVYLNRPVVLGGESDTLGLTANDVRLTAVTVAGNSYSPGSVVASADKDRTDYANQAASGTWVLKWFNADRTTELQNLRHLTDAKITGGDGVFASGEAAYIEDAATVETGAIRINAISFGEASTVAAGNPDIGASLQVLANVKITNAGVAGTFEAGEDAYIDADTSGTISNGDIRITSVGVLAAGGTVSCPADAGCGDTIVATTNSNYITGPDTTFTAGTDIVYSDNDGTANTAVAAGLIRITPISYAAGSTASCTSPANVDCGAALTALTNAKVTGSDGVWSSGSELVYVSADHGVTAGDRRISGVTFNSFTKNTATDQAVSDVASGDADLPASNVGAVDSLYLSLTGLSGAAPASKIPLHNDVRILAYSGQAFGTRVSTGHTDYTPRVLAGPTLTLYRWDKGITSQMSDDTFFASQRTADPSTPQSGDARLLASLQYAGGTMFSSGDSDGTASITKDTGAAFAPRVRFINPSASKHTGYDSSDFLYVDTTFFSGTGSGSISANDIRLRPTTGLSTNYNAGTLVQSSDADAVSFGTFGTDSGRTFYVKFLDQNNNGAFDGGGSDLAKIEHLFISADKNTCATATPCSTVLLIGDVPLTGSGGPSGSGGGTTTTTTTPAATLPTLSSATASKECAASGTGVTFTVLYTDALNRAPSAANMVLSGTNHPMTSSSSSYSSGVTFTTSVSMPSGSGPYATSFSFTNAGGTATLGGPTVTVLSSTAVAPTLTGPSVTPSTAGEGETFTWRVTYTDLNDNAPTTKRVIIDGEAHDMTSGDTTPCNGALYSFSKTLSAIGTHNYSFEFSDGTTTVRTPTSGVTEGPTVTATGTTGTTGTTDTNATDGTTPGRSTPGLPTFVVLLALVSVVAATAWFSRARKPS
jgi:hypothetical protein